MGERRAPSALGSVALVVVAVLLSAQPVLADDPPAERRVLDLQPRVLDLQPRVVDLRPRPERGSLAVPTDVLFAFGSATLTSSAGEVLGGLKPVVAAATGKSVTITGYTDAIGSDAFNLDLSKRRAAAVRDFLAPSAPGVRFVVVGKGEADPVAPNELNGKDNPDGRRLNRRVTVSIRG